MAEKYPKQVQGYPLAPATVVPRSDEEQGRNYQSEEEMKKKKRRKYLIIFVVFQVTLLLIFSLTVMNIKMPKMRLDDIQLTNNGGKVMLSGRVLVKNVNFGQYKFDGAVATVRSGENIVGQFAISEASAGARSTKKMSFATDISGNADWLEVVVEAELRGKVEVMKVIKKKKRARMSCAVTLVLSTSTVRNLSCN